MSELEKYASAIENKQETQLKTEYVAFLETYLKAAVICRKFNYPVEASVTYSRLFRQNKLASDYAIGYYLDKIATQKNDKRLREVAEINRQSGLKNIYPETMSLARRIEMLYLLQQDWELYGEQIELLENGLFKDVSQHSLEKNLLSAIRTDCFVAGYQFGISRFLLYWIYRNADKVTRMRLPFL